MKLEGKRAFVTGASGGIGAEVAKALASEGARVAVCHRRSEGDEDLVVKSITARGGRALAIHGDVSDEGDVSRMFAEAGRELGGLDILVNTAGVSDARLWHTGLQETALEDFRKVFSVDVFGTFLCSRAAAAVMREGSIVNVASTPAVAGDSEGLVYTAAKGAVLSMTRALARTLAPKIRVNCMVFGSIQTGWVEWLDEEERRAYTDAIPLRRFGSPAEAARLALFLAGDDSSFMTGQALILDGGEVMR